ncbi:MAG: helix-turn-helix domain-containing protein [Sulfolobales archaeon]|nr:helix-turn-helix domain-containing protein [Sulfolobales archaeon]MCX8209299.1 helix-turn-helix domain-containing protein [Sulfolobales archaeon]MDW8010440.1 helix-turn-helix domain-containing protein [Sulfolobales archaeon]
MIPRYVVDEVRKRIAGDIVFSENPGQAVRKWRTTFGLSQVELARYLRMASSVISDYEKNRRKPGMKFVRSFIEALLRHDEISGYAVTKSLAQSMGILVAGVVDIREFSKPVKLDELVTVVEGYIVNSRFLSLPIYGYTVINSYEAIEGLRGNEFWSIMGLSSVRALIFTAVTTGRSPMVAVRVAPTKPAAVVIHSPRTVDVLAIRLADRELLPLIVSTHPSVSSLVEALRTKLPPR